MVACLMLISAKTRRLIGTFDAILIAIIIFLETTLVLLRNDKLLEFYHIGVFQWLWKLDSIFLYSNFTVSVLLSCSILLLIFVFDVTISQESNKFHVELKDYSYCIYPLIVSAVLCILSYSLSLRISAEFDTKMTKLLLANYLNYGKVESSRHLVDQIHIEYSCCGVNSIEDFVDLSEIDGKLPAQTRLWSCNNWEYCGVPLSCCKTISCSQNVELLADGWDHTNVMEEWFNKNGCVRKLDNAYLLFDKPNYLLVDFAMIFVLGLHVCTIILTQILVTSSATLHEARLSPEHASYAWLVDIGQPDAVSLVKELNPALHQSEFAETSVQHHLDDQNEDIEEGKNHPSIKASTAETVLTTSSDSADQAKPLSSAGDSDALGSLPSGTSKKQNDTISSSNEQLHRDSDAESRKSKHYGIRAPRKPKNDPKTQNSRVPTQKPSK